MGGMCSTVGEKDMPTKSWELFLVFTLAWTRCRMGIIQKPLI